MSLPNSSTIDKLVAHLDAKLPPEKQSAEMKIFVQAVLIHLGQRTVIELKFREIVRDNFKEVMKLFSGDEEPTTAATAAAPAAEAAEEEEDEGIPAPDVKATVVSNAPIPPAPNGGVSQPPPAPKA